MFEKEYINPNEGFSQTVIVKTGNLKRFTFLDKSVMATI